MNIDNAIQAHAQWKFKLRQALFAKQTMDVKAIALDNQCELGKWLHGEAKTLFGKSAVYARCIADHAAFHIEASKIAAAINRSTEQDIEPMLTGNSGFSAASRKISVTLIELKQEMLPLNTRQEQIPDAAI